MTDFTATRGRIGETPAAPYVQMIGVTLALAALLMLPFLVTMSPDAFFIAEEGPVQVMSAAFYLVVVVSLLRECSWQTLQRNWYFVLVPLAMCLRELDFHTHFTTMTITKTSFYISPDVPLIEKVGAVAVFAVLGFAAYSMIRDHGRAFVHGLMRLEATPLAVFFAISSTVLSKALDGAARKLGDWGIVLSQTADILSVMAEETLELGIPLYLTIAVFAALGPIVRHSERPGR